MQNLPITQKGYEQLKLKISKLKAEFEKLPAIIGEARAKGDLKENAEYHAAREKQGMLNAQISKLNSDLMNSKVIEPNSLPNNIVTFGKKVTLTNLENNQEKTYFIVGPAETDFYKNSIAVTSSLIRSLLGKKEQEEIVVQVPSGQKKYKINSISL